MIEKKQPSNRQLKIGQQIRFLVSSFFIKEDFIFENFDSKNLTIVDVILSSDLKNAKIFVSTNSISENKTERQSFLIFVGYPNFSPKMAIRSPFWPKFPVQETA